MQLCRDTLILIKEPVVWFSSAISVLSLFSFIFFENFNPLAQNIFISSSESNFFARSMPYLFSLFVSIVSFYLLFKSRNKNTLFALIILLFNSVAIVIFFAIIYLANGLNGATCPTHQQALYFSLLTWTTLGYGDYSPTDNIQMVAAFQSFLGYMFLGNLAGISLSILQQKE